jgi:hypothetical protein
LVSQITTTDASGPQDPEQIDIICLIFTALEILGMPARFFTNRRPAVAMRPLIALQLCCSPWALGQETAPAERKVISRVTASGGLRVQAQPTR